MRLWVTAVLLAGAALTNGAAVAKDYQLKPQAIASGVYFFEGYNQDFTFANGGNIVNTGFIITDAGVVTSWAAGNRYLNVPMRYIRRCHPTWFS